ncbi:MAG: serine/threonine protein kinase [Pedosphaera sp.]|nr:serine/threonine protein kinase [Pedosphaera sp.]
MNTKHDSLRTIFNDAAELANPAERAAYLQQACGGNHDLRRKIEELLSAHGEAGSFLGDGGPTTILVPITERAGDRIGRYKLLQQIGEGGCGVVYMAEQEEPVRRRVAVKVIKLGMDTKNVIARFEAERQALAMMDHPNIAKVLDAGATDTGRPFFVMELVRGVKITEYCDQHSLTTRERLDLFIKVCQAIQHAHQKGIIHRDIKPSNILVTVNDGVAVPKVIDFGIAKATEGRLTNKTLFTQFEALIGTPAYMSPEQAIMTSLDIDTRSDIYSLGVLLYEILTGQTPFDGKELMAAGLDEMRRTIREQEPARPSTRLSTMLAAELTTTAKHRQSDAPKLINLLRGDLDWIVMKALEKDRARRYETANGFAADIQRHLNNEPVVARPPSATYRFQKMIRRNRSVALTTAVVALTLILALGFSTAAFFRERKARMQAAAAERAREEAKRATQAESVRADSVADFVTHFIEGAVPDLYRHGHREPIKRLFEVADRAAQSLSNAPLAEARLRFAMGRAYDETLYETGEAARQYSAAEKLASTLGQNGRDLAELANLRSLGPKLWDYSDTKAAGEEMTRELLARGKAALNRNPPNLRAAAFTFGVVAEYNMIHGSPEEAERWARECLQIARSRPADLELAPEFTSPLLTLVQLTSRRGAIKEAEEVTDELFASLQSARRGGPDAGQNSFLEFLSGIWGGDWTRLPEVSLRKALRSVSVEDLELRGSLQRHLGIAIARAGDWRGGLTLLQEAARTSSGSAELWNAEIQLATLLGDTGSQRSLMIDGLARFASGADGLRSQWLVGPMLLLPPLPEFLSTITNLVERSQQVPRWSHFEKIFTMALFRYRSGQFQDAGTIVDEYLSERPGHPAPRFDPSQAVGLFLRAALEMRRGNLNAAREAYRQGLRFHSSALNNPGTAYTGDHWTIACTAELIRREAASVMGSATPPDPPALSKP